VTVPGAPPGIYACAYRDLAGILVLLAEGRRALAAGNHTAVEARARRCLRRDGCLWRSRCARAPIASLHHGSVSALPQVACPIKH